MRKATMAPRDMYGKTIVELGKRNEKIFAMSADLAAATKLTAFSEEIPERYLNPGIAEQNMVGIAAGLARTGMVPFISTFCCFAPGRTYDQIRQSIAYNHLNVKIVSTHPGLAIGMDGAVHQALEDLALIRTIPEMVVVAPSDEVATKKAIEWAAEYEGAVYVRVGRKECDIYFQEDWEWELGKSYTLKEGNDITLIAHGSMVPYMMEAAAELAKEGISARVIDMPFIKPIDTETLVKAAKETKGFVVAEDHSVYGGLYSAVTEALAAELPCKVLPVAVQDTFGESAKPDELYEKYGLSVANIMAQAKRL